MTPVPQPPDPHAYGVLRFGAKNVVYKKVDVPGAPASFGNSAGVAYVLTLARSPR
jgi:hypothetical protein